MIPAFPQFKRLEISDKKEIHDLAFPLPPYSDFNFVSLYCWDIHNSVEISQLDGNLVVKFHDYITREEYYSICGVHITPEHLFSLREKCEQENIQPTLHLVPELTASSIAETSGLRLHEDRDNYDYVMDIAQQIQTAESRTSIGRKVAKFEKHYGPRVQTISLNLDNSAHQQMMLKLLRQWRANKDQSDNQYAGINPHEIAAIQKLFGNAKRLNIITTGLINEDGELVGMSVDEIITPQFAIGHFQKADTKYAGIYQYLEHRVNLDLHEKGVQFINIEQDLGLKNLHDYKMSHKPAYFLKKYSISFT